MKTISLNGIWSLRGRSECSPVSAPSLALEAEVPGCVQLDLSRAGILPGDLFMGENIRETEKYENWEWWYERTFTAPEERENVWLVFRGVDCIAEYYLNGVKFGESDNMLIPHEFEIGALLRDGENTLTVHLRSPIAYTHGQDYDIFNIAVSWRNTPVNTAIRRAPHSYGWDIMPRAVTSGLWRGVYLEVRDSVYFSQSFFDFSGGRSSFSYVTESKLADFHDIEIEIEAKCGDSELHDRFPAEHKAGRRWINIPNRKLWWPHGCGEANVYDAVLRIYRAGELLHETKTQFGIRTVKLDYTDYTDGKNGRFRFIVNGEEIMCRGSNWVPLDAFHCRDASRYAEALALVKDIGCNILRCWGGNVYEDHAFFDFCDRSGIMVWQDFSMACNNYPQSEAFLEQMRREATSVIREFRHHPSIILWSGDNEIDSMMMGAGARPSMNRITREILPQAVYRNDVGRPYLASSPYVSDRAFDDRTVEPAEAHLWGPRDWYKSDFYKQSTAHFVSETGYHGCPSLESIKKFITPEKVWPYQNNSEWILHSSDQKGNDGRVMLMEKQVRQFFGEVPTEPEEYILASQISQAEAKKYFLERIRVGRPNKSGVIWWNLLDGWPQMSDAIVDYYFTKKLAYRYLKRAQTPFAVALDELAANHQKVCLCNDTLRELHGRVTVIDADTEAVVFERSFTAAKNTTTVAGQIPVGYYQHSMFIIRWETELGEGMSHYLTGYPPFSLAKYKEWMEKYGL